MFRAMAGVAAVLAGLVICAPVGRAEPAPTLPVFTPYPSNWQPDYSQFPYNLWQMRVTPQQITAQRESCQWINAQYDQLMSQVYGFQHFLAEQGDYWTRPGVSEAGDTVAANLDQSAAFLDPRAHTLFIVNYPDQSEYSPLFHGDSIYRLWYQFTQISDKIKQRLPSGVINANIATANVYGSVIRNSGVCRGA
ncbi:hypothetical protein [Mycolicibacterium gilvum]|uniref:Secreted protein n=2 Tax=Mycolicibacterium gilvum TaxID=1804 RepID=E6TCQ0_MYCSR|nr:hypothetical protein [Mycolicibacterium gilvum]ADT97488.1 hypothetical protein Mspyr1_07890 [Mycolicibacterium gilvum Spyr1]MCV7056254.1 hypothetical protein [Mycolicibacterium gilvum]STZ41677.1 Uncharacterised protein [Mycolicibacterium gilvum]